MRNVRQGDAPGHQVTRYASALPAYGRDYPSQKAVKEAWDQGHDFLIQDMVLHGYVSKRDKPADLVLNVRYKRSTQVCVIK